MSFTPYNNYQLVLPVLKPGHIIKAGAGSAGGSGFWRVKRVQRGRIDIQETGSITKKQWIVKNGDPYRQVSGSLDTQKVVHIQYMAALDANVNATMYWGKDPLFCFDYDGSTVNPTIAPDVSPLVLDKWSYDQSMFLAVTISSGTQDFLMETVVYEVEAYKGPAPRRYLEITSDGNATFVEVPAKAPASSRGSRIFRDEEED